MAGPPQNIPDTSFKKEIYRWEVRCFDLKTGKELWKQVPYSGAPKAGKNPMGTYANETPVTDGKRIFAYFGNHGLYCYDMEGKPLWQKDLGIFYTQNGWGTGSSPVLYNGVLYIQFDNEEHSYIVAVDAATGNEKWKVQRDEKTTYSTPYIWKNKIRTEIVTCGKTARSYNPETGKLLWEMKMTGDMVIPSPVGSEELLYIGNTGGRDTKAKLFAVKAGNDGEITDAGIAWVTEESNLGNSTPLLYKDRLYVIGSRGEIAVLDAATGTLKYQKRINGIGSVWATPWANKDRIYFLDEKGTTRVFKAGDTFEQVAENKLEGKFWPSVAVAGNKYIFKGAEKLYCVGK
jgi:outer membrane protein assembly factor BamB